MPSFLPYSWRVVFGGLVEVLLDWVVFSAIISLVLVLTDWLIYIPSQALNGGSLSVFSLSNLTTAHLRSLPQFRYLDYYQYLWVGLIVVITIASLIYSIVISQKEDSEIIIQDFYADVASKAVIYVGLVLIVWILGFTVFGLFFSQYGIMNSSATLHQIMIEGQEGLKALAGSDISSRLMWVFEVPYPYIPAPAFFLAYVYILRNAHTGWLGNVWAQIPR